MVCQRNVQTCSYATMQVAIIAMSNCVFSTHKHDRFGIGRVCRVNDTIGHSTCTTERRTLMWMLLNYSIELKYLQLHLLHATVRLTVLAKTIILRWFVIATSGIGRRVVGAGPASLSTLLSGLGWVDLSVGKFCRWMLIIYRGEREERVVTNRQCRRAYLAHRPCGDRRVLW